MENYKMRELERTFFDVNKVENDSRLGYMIVDSYGRRIADVSKNYRLVTNKELVMPFINHYGIDRFKGVKVNGNKFFYEFDLAEDIDLGDGDILRKKFILGNSYNKTAKFKLQHAVFRKACSNGMFVFASGVNINIRHYGNMPVSDWIQQSINSLSDFNFDNWRNLKKVKLSLSDKKYLISGFQAFDAKVKGAKSDRMNSIIRDKAKFNARKRGFDLENPANGWGLLNNLNWGIAKAVGFRSSITQTINANERAENYLLNKLNLN